MIIPPPDHPAKHDPDLTSLVERGLTRQLLAKFHMDVAERRSLPNGKARFSVVLSIVAEALEEDGWFPHPVPPNGMIGDGAVLEMRNSEVWLHEQHERSVGSFFPIEAHRKADLTEAVRAYISLNGGEAIDGVEIDWDK